MAKAKRSTTSLGSSGEKAGLRAQKARTKVAQLLQELVAIGSREELETEIANGLNLTWEALRFRAGCGTEALTKNNPDLKEKLRAEKGRLERLLKGNEQGTKQRSDTHSAVKQRLAAAVAERDLAHWTNVQLLERIAKLELELMNLKRNSIR